MAFATPRILLTKQGSTNINARMAPSAQIRQKKSSFLSHSKIKTVARKCRR